MRREITDILSPKWRYDEREQAGKPLNILIVGGSLGAKALNERLPPALKQLQVPLNIFTSVVSNKLRQLKHFMQMHQLI